MANIWRIIDSQLNSKDDDDDDSDNDDDDYILLLNVLNIDSCFPISKIYCWVLINYYYYYYYYYFSSN